jgi:NADH-quinone oxidoreductase subunit N
MFLTPDHVESLQSAVGNSLLLFLPELVVCVGIVTLLLVRLFGPFDRVHLGGLAVATLSVSWLAAVYQLASGDPGGGAYFAGMLVGDPFSHFVRSLVLFAALLTALLTRLSGLPDTADSADFHVLLLGGTLGMLLMAGANHLLMVFIAVEMASLPGYALAGFVKGQKTGSEAALKYVVYGAAASGVMLYGITLLAGLFGTGYLPDVAAAAARRGFDLPVLAAAAMVFVGLGFKLAAVPFHFWCPDVFEGAAAEVAGFLSVASKAAAVALTLRLVLTLQTLVSQVATGLSVAGTFGVALGLVAALTVTFGNLAAFAQTNLKRLLAYSTIAHAGYMLLAVATVTTAGAAAVLYYLVAYVLMNLGAFAVVALVRNATGGGETLDTFRGLARRSPVLAVAMTVCLLSLLGLPPLAGFAGKFQVFAAVYDAGRSATIPGLGNVFFVLLGVGAVNTALSAYYYLKVGRMMLLEGPDDPTPVHMPPAATAYLVALTVGIVVVGVLWDPITRAAQEAVSHFR